MTAARPDLSRFFELLDAVPVAADAETLYAPDRAGGDLRRRNLQRYFDLIAAQTGTGGQDPAAGRMLLVGEAPGWRGATNTGVSFMSVRELDAMPGLMTADPAGDGFESPASPTAPWEASSRVVWAALDGWRGPLPLFWPIFPHHPFEPGKPLTNRTPRPQEVRDGTPVALELARAFDARRIVAVGRKAQGALALSGVDAEAVRHPAQGGAALFTAQLRALGGLAPSAD